MRKYDKLSEQVFSSPEPKDHRCRYSIPVAWRQSVFVIRRRRSQYSNIFSSKAAWIIKAKFYVEPPLVGGHMTKMAATPIYGKNP